MTRSQTTVPEPGPPGDADPGARRMRRRVLTSSFVGSVIEWYDFYLFGVASAAVFNVLFFPEFSPAAGVLASFATLAAGFLARPIGGIIWGHFGDRVGRKQMLVLSILLMGVATTAVGLLPTYAQIGIWAPILLVVMRVVQGISAGGEWGGAVLMSMEHSSRRRGLSSSWAQMGLYGGILLANGVFALVSLLDEAAFLSWGWRIPFLASAVLVLVGLWIRLGIEESPIFRKSRDAQAGTPRLPLVEVLRRPRNLLVSIMLVLGPFAASAVYGTFAVTYGLEIGFATSDLLGAVLLSSAIGFVGQPIFAVLSDYVGRKPVVAIGAVLQALTIFTMFAMMDTGDVGMMYVGLALAALAHAVVYSPLGAWLGELFPTHTRYTGASLGYQLAGTIGGGLTPFICAALLTAAGGPPNSIGISLYMAATCVLTLVGVVMARETYRSAL